MARIIQKMASAFLAVSIAGLAPITPAYGFEIFGITLFGGNKNESAAGSVSYTFDFQAGDASRGLARALRASSSLIVDKDIAEDNFAELLARAKSDYRGLLATLYTEGYYAGDISITIQGREAADIPFTAQMPSHLNIVISVNPGAGFEFGSVSIMPVPTPKNRREDVFIQSGLVAGDTARATSIAEAVDLALGAWRQNGYALAEVADKSVIAQHPTSELDVDITINPGRLAHFGNVSVTGMERLDPEFLRYMLRLPQGEIFDPADLSFARERLMRTGALQSANIIADDTIAADGSLAFTLDVNEMPLRNFGFGIEYSTFDGVGIRGTWMHRNLFGRAEQLRFDASVERINFNQSLSDFDYNVTTTFTKPGFLVPDMDFSIVLQADHQAIDHIDLQNFDLQTGVKFRTRALELGAYTFVSYSEISDINGFQQFLRAGLHGEARIDKRDNLLNPHSGFYLAADMQGMQEFEFDNTILRGTLEGRIYRSFGKNDQFVLAGRGMVGSIYGASIAETPDDLLFFAGGDGSVRGFGYQNIGTTDLGVFSGGSSIIELNAELRVQINDSIGVVAFADASEVGNTAVPGETGDWRYGAGLGVRYFSPLGPIRLDIARGFNRGADDPEVGVYIGLGHAF